MNRLNKVSIIAVILILLSTCQTFAAIENWKKSPWTEEKTYVDKSINKLGFGLLNVSIGWTALFFEPTRHSNIFTGVLKGIWRTVTNEAGGALHTVTFFIPVDIPLPDGGVNFEEGNEEAA
jgi:hypothetical protein